MHVETSTDATTPTYVPHLGGCPSASLRVVRHRDIQEPTLRWRWRRSTPADGSQQPVHSLLWRPRVPPVSGT